MRGPELWMLAQLDGESVFHAAHDSTVQLAGAFEANRDALAD